MTQVIGVPQPIQDVVKLETRTTPSRMAPSLLEYQLTVDQLAAVGSGNWQRSLAYYGNRAITVTPTKVSWQTWAKATGVDMREIKSLSVNLPGVTLTSNSSTVRPMLRTFDKNRVVMLHAGTLYVFDDRAFTMKTIATGLSTPGDPYTANPRLAVAGDYVVVFPNATGGTQGSGTAYLWGFDAAGNWENRGGVSVGTSINALNGAQSLGHDDDSGLVVLAATGVRGTTRALFLYRNGAGTLVRYYARVVDVATGALGDETPLGVGNGLSPSGFGEFEEGGADTYQGGAIAEDPIRGVYIGLMAKRARFSVTSGTGGGTLPGIRVLQFQPSGLSVAVQVDGSRRVGSESLSTSQQFIYEEAFVAKDDQTRWSFDGYGDNGNSKAVAVRVLPDDVGNFLAVRQLLGVDIPTIQDTFDLATIVLPWVQLLPIPSPPRPTIPKPPTRAYYLAGVSGGAPVRARVFHRNRGRGVLKVRPDSMTQHYDEAARPL